MSSSTTMSQFTLSTAPLRHAYTQLLHTLNIVDTTHQTTVNEDVDETSNAFHEWSIHAIQTLTHAAPPVRKTMSGSGGSGNDGITEQATAHASLVLAFLIHMLQTLQQQQLSSAS